MGWAWQKLLALAPSTALPWLTTGTGQAVLPRLGMLGPWRRIYRVSVSPGADDSQVPTASRRPGR